MPLETILLLFSIGLVGGVWNAIAGGATLFTFPALMAVGLPSLVANATNYLAMLPSNLSALPAYRQELREIGHRVWPLMAYSGLGAICGSLLLTVSDPKLFDALIPFLILFATGLFAFGDLLRARAIRHFGDHASQTLARIALFAFSIYGGYFGAGLGIILLAMVQIMGFATFHMANSLKNLLAASFTILSIGVFGMAGSRRDDGRQHNWRLYGRPLRKIRERALSADRGHRFRRTAVRRLFLPHGQRLTDPSCVRR